MHQTSFRVIIILLCNLLCGWGFAFGQEPTPSAELFPQSFVKEKSIREIRQYSLSSTRVDFENPKIFISKNLEKIQTFDTTGRLIDTWDMPDSLGMHKFRNHFDYKNEPSGFLYTYYKVNARGDTVPFIQSDKYDYYSKYDVPDSSLWFSVGENDKRLPEHKIIRRFADGRLARERYYEFHNSREHWKEVRYYYPELNQMVQVAEMSASGYRDSTIFFTNAQGNLVRKLEYSFVYSEPEIIYTDYIYDMMGRLQGSSSRSANRALLDRAVDWPYSEHAYGTNGLPEKSYYSGHGYVGKLVKYQYFFYKEPAKDAPKDKKPDAPGN